MAELCGVAARGCIQELHRAVIVSLCWRIQALHKAQVMREHMCLVCATQANSLERGKLRTSCFIRARD